MRNIRSRLAVYAAALLCIPALGCGELNSAPQGSAWGPAFDAPLLEPIQGTWRLDVDATNAALGEDSPVTYTDPYDITIDGHVITIPHGFLESEYRLFSLHDHDGWICGRAWHHEDRHDPGDMSKIHLQLKADGKELVFKQKVANESVDGDDPDLTLNSSVLASDSKVCPLENDFEYTWMQDWDELHFDKVE